MENEIRKIVANWYMVRKSILNEQDIELKKHAGDSLFSIFEREKIVNDFSKKLASSKAWKELKSLLVKMKSNPEFEPLISKAFEEIVLKKIANE